MLIETLQGNSSGVNAAALLETKLIELCDRLLIMPRNRHDGEVFGRDSDNKENSPAGDAPLVDGASRDLMTADDENLMIKPIDMLKLRAAALTLLHAMVEGESSDVLVRMSQVVHLKVLSNLAGYWHDVYGAIALKGRTSVAERLEGELAMHAAFLAVTLVRRITDGQPELADSTFASMSEEASDYFDRFVGRVELCTESAELERIYFRVPEHFLLAPRTKDAVLWGVDRETPGQAVQEFLLMTPDLHVEVMWQAVVGQNMIWKLVVKYEFILNNASVFLALVQNALLLVDSSIIHETIGNGGATNIFNTEWSSPPEAFASWNLAYSWTRTILASVQIFTCSLAAIVTLGRSTFVNILTKWHNVRGVSMEQTVAMLTSPLSHFTQLLDFLWLSTYIVLLDINFLVRCAFVAFGILGLVVRQGGERFFVIHLFQVVLANKGLLDVLRAVTQNGKRPVLETFASLRWC